MANIKRFLTLIFISTLSALTMSSWGTVITNEVYEFNSSSTPTGWTVGSSNTHASGYLKLSDGDYLEMSTATVFASGENLSSANMKVEVSCGTFGTWSGNKSVLCTVELQKSDGTVLSSANATFSSLNNSEGTYRTAIYVSKPTDPTQIAKLHITLSSFTTGSTLRVKYVRLNYETSAPSGGVTAPTFDIAAGGYCESQTIKASNYSSSNTYYYTLDGTEPSSSSTLYDNSTGVVLSPSLNVYTLKMIAYDGSLNASSVTTAAYAIVPTNTAATAYTVAQVKPLMDAGATCSNVFIKGYVTQIVTAYNSTYKNISFNISDDGTQTNEFQFYRAGYLGETCAVLSSDPGVVVGDYVIGKGTLKIYNSTYEFEAGSCFILNPVTCVNPYNITLANSGTAANGTFFSNKATACEDETVTLTATPATGYQLASWSVYQTAAPNTPITVTNNQFTMPAYAVTVSATFEPLVIEIVLTNKSNGHVQSCVNEGSATVSYDGTALTSFSPVSRDGFNAPTGYWTAASGGTMVLNADGSFADINVQDYITNGHWINATTPIELLARISCSDTIRLTTAGSNGIATLSPAKIGTCNCTDEARRVTITATPNSGYEVASISYSGDGTATKVSGPTASGSNTIWIYEFAQGDNGNGTFTVTYSPLPSYTVTWDANGTTSTMSVTKGDKPTFPSSPTACDATSTTFVGWSTDTWEGKIENLTGKTVYISADDMPAVTGPVTYYAVWAKVDAEASNWVETALGDLTSSDVFVFSTGTRAMTNDNGASAAPGSVSITVSGGKITSEVDDNLKWNLSKSGDDYTFYPNGSTTTWLYCNTTAGSSSNNNMRVGTGDRKNFKTNGSGYLVTDDSYTARYLSTYGDQDFRGYVNTDNAFVPVFFAYTAGGGYTDYITTCCTEVSRPEVTVTIRSTSVTLTWAKQGTATYTVTCSGGTVGSVTGDATKTCTITGLTAETPYTYSVRVSGATCSQTASGSFTTSFCDDVPVVSSVVPAANSVRFVWTCENNSSTIKLYSDEECTTEIRSKTSTAKSDSIAGLTNGTTYYYKIWSGTCPSAPGSFTTNENSITIAEWDTCAVYLDLGDMASATALVQNQNTQAVVTQNYADQLFFSKYFEAASNVKLLAIFNGTENAIDLSNYKIAFAMTQNSPYQAGSFVSYAFNEMKYDIDGTKYFFTSEQLLLESGKEIILISYQNNNTADDEITKCAKDNPVSGYENYYRLTTPQMQFNGDDAVALINPSGTFIDLIGAGNSTTGNISHVTKASGSSGTVNGFMDAPGGWYTEHGYKSNSDHSETNDYKLSTNRCLLIRRNHVKNGNTAVALNTTDFVTLGDYTYEDKNYEGEWKGIEIPGSSSGDGSTNSCNGFDQVGSYDYNEYYAKFDTIMSGVNLTDQRQEDGTYKIEISQLDTMSCTNLRIVVEDNNTHEKVSGTWKVPIFVTNDGGTNHDGNVKTNDNVFTKEGPDCASCDVVVLKDANLQVVAGGKNQVRNIEVYNGAKLYVPEGQTFTINELVLRSKDDTISRLDIRGTISQTADKFGFDKRIKATRWYKIALPYRCKISDVTFRNGEEATYGKDWVLRTYNGDRRANGTESGNWNNYTGEYMEAGVGYNLAINADILEPGNKYAELRFPMAPNAGFAEPASINVPVVAYGANNSRTKDGEPVTPNHLGWNMIGNPYMMDYKTGTNGGNMSQFIAGKLDIVDEKYQLTENGLRYVVKLNENSREYEQIAIGDGTKNIEPFLAYFVQIGGSSDNQGLNVQFVKGQQEGRSSIIRRNPAEYEEVDNHPVWCVINLTNVLDEQDETTFLISDDFTNDYDMMDDLVKMRGDKYTKYTKPVLASRNNAGEMAFNALPDQSAAAGIPLNYFAAADGDFTIALDGRFGIEELKDVQLYDSQEKKWIDLRMENNYPFYTTAGNNDSRFMLYVTVERKQPEVTTNIDNATSNLTLTTIDRTLIVSGLTSNSDIYVYDVSGKLLNTERHSSSASGIFRTTVEDPGVYFVRVNGTDGQQTLRTIVY